jgi:uncharacterized membrane protein
MAVVREVAVTQVDVAALRQAQLDASNRAIVERADLISGTHAEVRVTEYTSLLPPPDYLDQYEQRMPGLSRALVDDAFAGKVHDRKIEEQRVSNKHALALVTTKTAKTQVWLAFVVAIAGLSALTVVGVFGHPASAAALAALEAAAGAGLFVKLRDRASRKAEK